MNVTKSKRSMMFFSTRCERKEKGKENIVCNIVLYIDPTSLNAPLPVTWLLNHRLSAIMPWLYSSHPLYSLLYGLWPWRFISWDSLMVNLLLLSTLDILYSASIFWSRIVHCILFCCGGFFSPLLWQIARDSFSRILQHYNMHWGIAIIIRGRSVSWILNLWS